MNNHKVSKEDEKKKTRARSTLESALMVLYIQFIIEEYIHTPMIIIMGTKYTTQTKAIRQYKKKLHIKHSTIQVQPTFLYKFQPFFSSSTLHLVNKYTL